MRTPPVGRFKSSMILAYELDCYEAGESLVRARIGESLRNGRYQRRRTDTLQFVLKTLREMKDDLVTRGIIRARAKV